jgi:hypothetical protein
MTQLGRCPTRSGEAQPHVQASICIESRNCELSSHHWPTTRLGRCPAQSREAQPRVLASELRAATADSQAITGSSHGITRAMPHSITQPRVPTSALRAVPTSSRAITGPCHSWGDAPLNRARRSLACRHLSALRAVPVSSRAIAGSRHSWGDAPCNRARRSLACWHQH